jgi:uncharacterized protein (TIGR00730 family)
LAGPREPWSPDEELLEAETLAIASRLDDGARVDRMAAELRAGFDALRGVGRAVAVFGSARTPPDDPAYAEARSLARRLGEDGCAVITGGGPGIMRAANEGAHEAGAPSIGLTIDLPHEQGVNPAVDLRVDFHYFFARKVMFVRYASAFVVFPGGFGTLDELFEAATLRQTEKVRHFPIVLWDSRYWEGLVSWLRDPVLGESKVDSVDLQSLEATDDPERVLGLIRTAEAVSQRR